MRARLEYRVALLAFVIHLHGTPLHHTLQSEVLHTRNQGREGRRAVETCMNGQKNSIWQHSSARHLIINKRRLQSGWELSLRLWGDLGQAQPLLLARAASFEKLKRLAVGVRRPPLSVAAIVDALPVDCAAEGKGDGGAVLGCGGPMARLRAEEERPRPRAHAQRGTRCAAARTAGG